MNSSSRGTGQSREGKIDQKADSASGDRCIWRRAGFSTFKEARLISLFFNRETLENKEFRGTFGSSIVVYTLDEGQWKR